MDDAREHQGPAVPRTPDPSGPHRHAPFPRRLERPVSFADRVPLRQRRREDLIDVVLCLIGVVFSWLFGMFANSTTQGVTEDVLRVSVVRDLLLLPVTFIEGMVVLVAPVAVIVELARRRRLTAIVECLLSATLTAVFGGVLLVGLRHLPESLTLPLRVHATSGEGTEIALNIAIMALVALFTVAGQANNMRAVGYSWWGLWLIVFLGVLRGSMSLPGAFISVLLGRACGSFARWVLGFEDRRASGVDLVAGLLSIGVQPSRIVRVDLDTSEEPLSTWIIDEDDSAAPAGAPSPEAGAVPETTPAGTPSSGDRAPAAPADADELEDDLSAPVAVRALRQRPAAEPDITEYTVTRRVPQGDRRHYQVWDTQGAPLDLVVIDPGREITGTARDIWNNLRLRGISRWISPSLKANAERSTLTTLSAMRAGVHVPEPVGLAQAGASVLEVNHSLPPTSRLRDLPPEILTDQILDEVWRQLLLAHAHGLAHRDLTFDAVVMDQTGAVWIVDWEQGEVATTELNRRIDIAQLLIHLTVCVGQERALESARRVLSDRELRAVAPVVQGAILPEKVSAAVRRTDTVAEVRDAIVGVGGDQEGAQDGAQAVASVQPLKLQRFQPRTVITATVLVLALIVVMGSLNFDSLVETITQANPLWFLIAFVLGALTWVGGAIPLKALSSEEIPLWDAILAQVAASVVTIVAPAGIGPAALNLRFLGKLKVPTAIAATTVVLQQISQFLVSVVLLIVVILFTGSSLGVSVPYTTILAVAAVLVIVVAVVLSVPRIRHWIWMKAEPTWHQIYPRLLWIVGQPRRILEVLGGNLLMNIGFIGAFWASVEAFGGQLPLTTLAVTFLVSNSLGSVIPSPGGIGPVEGALTGGLTVAGLPVSVALSAAVLYRLVTFYGRVPFGYFATRHMQKKGLL